MNFFHANPSFFSSWDIRKGLKLDFSKITRVNIEKSVPH